MANPEGSQPSKESVNAGNHGGVEWMKWRVLNSQTSTSPEVHPERTAPLTIHWRKFGVPVGAPSRILAPQSGHVSNFHGQNVVRSNRSKWFQTKWHPPKTGTSIQTGYPNWTHLELAGRAAHPPGIGRLRRPIGLRILSADLASRRVDFGPCVIEHADCRRIEVLEEEDRPL